MVKSTPSLLVRSSLRGFVGEQKQDGERLMSCIRILSGQLGCWPGHLFAEVGCLLRSFLTEKGCWFCHSVRRQGRKTEA